MTNRWMYKVGVVVLAAGLFGACGSDDPVSTSGGTETTDAPEGEAPADGDLCSVIPDLATIEAAIGEAVKDPLGVGEAGFQQSCTLLRAADDFPGVTLTLVPGGTIAGQTEFVKTNFDIDIVPLDGADGFYAGEGTSVYSEANGNLYQASASLSGDADPRAAALALLQAWLAM